MKNEFKRITVKAQIWWGKPLNGTNGKKSFLMKGGEVSYEYEGRAKVQVSKLEEFIKENKEKILDELEMVREKAGKKKPSESIYVTTLVEKSGTSRMIKGIRGAIRHRVMKILYEKNIDYCVPTQKKEFQGTKEPTLLDGEHLMDGCGENPCPIKQLFGTWNKESSIRVWSDVIVESETPIEKIRRKKGIAFGYSSMEERHAARRDRKTLQNFLEQYISSEFQFYIEYDKELPNWLIGLLLEGILSVSNLGNGRSAGYGRVEIKEIAFEKITFERKLGKETNGRIAIIEDEQIVSQNKKVEEYLTAWSKHN
ncbi:MAG: RAMP superfamily CRISPR-associated protein [Candidatus Heimdallarchaeota archaeon]